MRLSRRALLLGAVAGITSAGVVWYLGGPIWRPIYYKLVGRRTVADALAMYGPNADPELKALHDAAGILYPPKELALIATKSERRLEVWASNEDGHFKHLATYEILGASGGLGPKLREGDGQVPEGVYRIAS